MIVNGRWLGVARFVFCLVLVAGASCYASIPARCWGQGDLRPASRETETVLTGGWVFDTASGQFQENKGILVRDGRFVSLDYSDTEGSESRIDLAEDEYILPGLCDLHAHYNVRLFRKRREEFDVIPIQYLANGTTVTFSAGEYDPQGMHDLRLAIEEGERVGPRLINSGPYFGRARPTWGGQKSKQEIEAEVDAWARLGVGGFKAKAIGAPELQVLIDRAHQHGLSVTGHLDSGFRGSVNPRDAIGMGIDRIEHFLGGDAMPDTVSAYRSLPDIRADMPEFKKIVQLYVDRDVTFDATITAYGYFGERGDVYEYWFDERSVFTPYVQAEVAKRTHRPNARFEAIFQAKRQTIDDFWRAGGKITLGTDHFSDGNYLPGFGAHREMDVLARAGIPPADVLRIATINGARALGIEAQHGSIEVGKSADLYVVRGNPLEDIKNTRRGRLVMTGGRLYRCAELLESIKGRLGPADETEAADW